MSISAIIAATYWCGSRPFSSVFSLELPEKSLLLRVDERDCHQRGTSRK